MELIHIYVGKPVDKSVPKFLSELAFFHRNLRLEKDDLP